MTQSGCHELSKDIVHVAEEAEGRINDSCRPMVQIISTVLISAYRFSTFTMNVSSKQFKRISKSEPVFKIPFLGSGVRCLHLPIFGQLIVPSHFHRLGWNIPQLQVQ